MCVCAVVAAQSRQRRRSRSLILSKYLVEKKRILKNIPGLDADASRAPVGVSSPSLLSTERCVLLVVYWLAGMGPAVGGSKRERCCEIVMNNKSNTVSDTQMGQTKAKSL
jgi:hypothetical protein